MGRTILPSWIKQRSLEMEKAASSDTLLEVTPTKKVVFWDRSLREQVAMGLKVVVSCGP